MPDLTVATWPIWQSQSGGRRVWTLAPGEWGAEQVTSAQEDQRYESISVFWGAVVYTSLPVSANDAWLSLSISFLSGSSEERIRLELAFGVQNPEAHMSRPGAR